MRRGMMVAPAAGGGAAVFPTAGLYCFYDPSDVSRRTVVSGGVTTMTDSINGIAFTLPYGAGSQPPLNVGNLNGFDTIRTSPGHSLWKQSPSPALPTGDWSMFVICDPRGGSGAAFGNGWNFTGSGIICNASGVHSQIMASCDSSVFFPGTGITRLDYSDDNGASLGTFDIILLTRTSGVYELFKNGVSLYTPASPTSAQSTASPAIGYGILHGTGEWGTTHAGDLGVAGIYDHALSSTERHNLFHSLGTKYAITVV